MIVPVSWKDVALETSYRMFLFRVRALFQEQGQCLFIVLAARSPLSPTVFHFSSFILWVGIVGLGSSN